MNGRCPLSVRLAGVLLIALNLRPAMASLSPLLETIRVDLGLSHAAVGLLTSIPVVCMGAFPILADRVAARLGTERALLGALALLTVALAARLVGSAAVLFGTAFAGGLAIAAAQTFVPAVVKRSFAERGAVVMGSYATAMTVGAGVPAASSASLAELLGGWPLALAVWSLPALAALLLWAPLAREAPPGPTELTTAERLPWRSPTAWRVSLIATASFGLFWSVLTWLAPVYRDQGWTDTQTGALLGANATAQIAASAGLSALVGRTRDRRPWLAAGLLITLVGLGGVGLLPATAPWLWAVVVGAGIGLLFPLALVLPLDFASDPAAVRRLTAMALSVGYLLGALGPLLVGWLRGATGGFAVPFVGLALFCAAMLLVARGLRPAHAAAGA